MQEVRSSMALNPKIFVINNVYVNNRRKMDGVPMVRRKHWIREICRCKNRGTL